MKSQIHRKRPRLGSVVAVTLRDHGLGGNVPLIFDAYGRVTEVTPHELILAYWHYSPAGAVDCATADDNVETVRIVRGAIVSWRELLPPSGWPRAAETADRAVRRLQTA